MKKFRHFLAMIALVLAVCIFISSEPIQMVSAAVGTDMKLSKQYLSEVKMFYGKNEEEARKACEKEGFTFSATNLNEGAYANLREEDEERGEIVKYSVSAYLGYKTTEDPGDAITDLTLLDMKNTHYEEIDYEEFLDKHIEDFRDQAAQMMVLVNEMNRKMVAGSPNALMAYDSLNLIYVDEAKDHEALNNQLGYYLINDADITFFEKFIQRGSSMVLGRINDLLCSAASDYNEDGTTWVDRSKTDEVAVVYPNATSEEQNMYDQQCQDPAKTLVKKIRDFSDLYTEAKERFDTYGDTFGYSELEGMTEENAYDKLSAAGTNCRYPEYTDAMKTYALLDAIPYQRAGETVVNKATLLTETTAQNTAGSEQATEAGEQQNAENTQKNEEITQTYSNDMTLAQYFMELANDATLEDHLSVVYPLVHSMTQAQRIVLSIGGLSVLVEGLYQANDYTSKRSEAIKYASRQLKNNGCEDGRLYLWSGMDRSLYNKKVVKTDASKEAEASGVDLENSINEKAKKEQSTLNQSLMIVDICTLGYGGIMMITNAILGATLWTIGSNCITVAGMNIAAGMVGTAFAGYAIGGVLCAMWVLNYVCIAVGLVMLIVSILQWCGVFDQKPRIDYSEIPDAVFDARKTAKGAYSVRYDSVKSNMSKEFFGDDNQRFLNGVISNIHDISSEHAEMNGYQGFNDRWVALYYSKAPAAGEPIEVKAGENPFITRDNYRAPEGYRPLTLIVSSTAENINDVEIISTKGPARYMFFPGKSTAIASGTVAKDNGTYISSVRLSYSKDRQEAINYLKKHKYEYFDVNLTPYDGYTYLGYQRGAANGALTDIRIANSTAESITFGDAKYALMGTTKEGLTPDGMGLYASTDTCVGSPIISLSIQNKRLAPGNGMEPVCLFSGGDAVDIGKRWKDNICASGEDDEYAFFTLHSAYPPNYEFSKKSYSHEFISEEDPSNGIYIYFQPKEQFKSTDKNGEPAQRYIGGFSYFLAGDKGTTDNRFGTNYEYMQKFASENGFELVKENGEPVRVMSDEAGEMTMATAWRDVGGYPADTYNFDQVHTVHNNTVLSDGDGGLISEFCLHEHTYEAFFRLTRRKEKLIFHTAMYFGVSYTYNPHRAITGVTGLINPYTETSAQIKNTGIHTPAGTFRACNVSIQGCPMMSPGITAGYYQWNTMIFPLYTNYEARQESDLSWMTDKETEVLSRYLLTAGARNGVDPLKEGDIRFVTHENPGKIAGYVPLCDMRTPGDYGHPMNFALDTTNKGSKYLYLYLAINAGGRVAEDKKVKDPTTRKLTTKKVNVPLNNEYTAKKYVGAVCCGVGKTPDQAIVNLYENATRLWPNVASNDASVSARPMVTEFDEIIPVDLSSEHPWYTLHTNDTNVKSLKNGDWVRGNEMAYYRWEGHEYFECLRHQKTVDDYERDFKCAYVGVIRTAEKSAAAYGVLKYYTDKDVSSNSLKTGSTDCTLAGGPIQSPEGRYYLYYSENTGTASNKAAITRLEISDDIFINGYNTSFTVSESDRKDGALPEYGQLRMRTDEYKYIHLGYDREDMPYYEKLYIGVGKTKNDAYVDMVGTTNAFAAMDVNCNYNSYSDTWIAIGYRRTALLKNAITDIFLYQGDNPPNQITINDGYMENPDFEEEEEDEEEYVDDDDYYDDDDYGDDDEYEDDDEYGDDTKSEDEDSEGTEEKTPQPRFIPYAEEDAKGVSHPGITYKLVKHNLKNGSEVVSLNKGNGGEGLYLYYTTKKFYTDMSYESVVNPITNICFTYGDISPRFASAQQLGAAFERSYYSAKTFDLKLYENPIWECVLGVTGSPENWKLTGEGATRFSLNQGVLPGVDGNGWAGSDNRVYMYTDRAYAKAEHVYQVRKNGKLPEFGYYAPLTTFGLLKQVEGY